MRKRTLRGVVAPVLPKSGATMHTAQTQKSEVAKSHPKRVETRSSLYFVVVVRPLDF